MKKLFFKLRLIVGVLMIVIGNNPKATTIVAVSLVSYYLGYEVLTNVLFSICEFLNNVFNKVCMLLLISFIIYKVVGLLDIRKALLIANDPWMYDVFSRYIKNKSKSKMSKTSGEPSKGPSNKQTRREKFLMS